MRKMTEEPSKNTYTLVVTGTELNSFCNLLKFTLYNPWLLPSQKYTYIYTNNSYLLFINKLYL